MSVGATALRCESNVEQQLLLALTQAQHVVDVLASLVTKAISSIGPLLPPAGKRASESKEGERYFAVLRGAALVMYKASPTSRLKGSASLAQLLKAICGFSCQLILHPSQSESNINLSFVCLRACIKWFGFNPNIFAGLRETVFQAAFGVAGEKRPIMSSAPAAAAVLCVNIALASCDLSSPPVTSICAALASAIMTCPSNSQLIQASSVPLPLPCQYSLAIFSSALVNFPPIDPVYFNCFTGNGTSAGRCFSFAAG